MPLNLPMVIAALLGIFRDRVLYQNSSYRIRPDTALFSAFQHELRTMRSRVLGRHLGYPDDVDTLLLRVLLVMCAGWMERRQANAIAYLLEENRVLREHVLTKRVPLTDAQRRRLARKGKLLSRTDLRRLATIAKPETILAWYRRLVARKYDGSRKRGPGRPRTRPDVVKLILEMAKANPGWGYTRIRGALQNLGFSVGRSLESSPSMAWTRPQVDPSSGRPSWRRTGAPFVERISSPSKC